MVVGPPGYTAALYGSANAHYTAQGTVEWGGALATGEVGSGIVETLLPAQPVVPSLTFTLVKDGKTYSFQGDNLSWQQQGSMHAVYFSKVQEAVLAYGRITPSTTVIKNFERMLKDSLDRSHLPAQGTDLTIRWAGEAYGKPMALFTLQQPGQGALAFAYTVTSGRINRELSLLLPAEGVASRIFACHLQDPGTVSQQVVVVAPARAARVTVAIDGAEPVDVDLDAAGMGTLTIDPSQEASVTAYTEDGSALGSTPVRTLAPFDSMIGDTPQTRVVP